MGPRPKRGTAHTTGGGGTPPGAPFAASTWEARQFASSSARQQAEIFTLVFIDTSSSHGLACDGLLEAAKAADTLRCKASAGFAQRVDPTWSGRRTPWGVSTNPPHGVFPPVAPPPELTLSRRFH